MSRHVSLVLLPPRLRVKQTHWSNIPVDGCKLDRSSGDRSVRLPPIEPSASRRLLVNSGKNNIRSLELERKSNLLQNVHCILLLEKEFNLVPGHQILHRARYFSCTTADACCNGRPQPTLLLSLSFLLPNLHPGPAPPLPEPLLPPFRCCPSYPCYPCCPEAALCILQLLFYPSPTPTDRMYTQPNDISTRRFALIKRTSLFFC